MTGAPHHYRIFDLILASQLELPELPVLPAHNSCGVQSSVAMSFAPGTTELDVDGLEWYHDWELDDGEICLSGAYSDEGYVLRFPDLADFKIDGLGRDNAPVSVSAYPVDDLPAETLRHLLLDQVIPRVVAQRGALVVHGSANRIDDDCAVAFLGETGFGKSTLGVAMHQRGYALLGDDCLAIAPVIAEETEDSVAVTASYVGARLISDSLDALYAAGAGAENTAPVAHYSDKARIAIPGVSGDNTRCQLAAVFLLNNPNENPHVGEPVIEQLTGADAVMALVSNAFQLDVTDRDHLTRQFMAFGREIVSRVPVYRVSYARDYDGLDDLCDSLVESVIQHNGDPNKGI